MTRRGPEEAGEPDRAVRAKGDVSLPVTADDVRAAARRIAGAVAITPSARSEVLSELTGADIVVKFEQLQFTASFKERGALNRLLTLDPSARDRGVLAVSAGNHAQAVAHHARRLGIRATVVMPIGTSFTKVTRTEALGARVVLEGETLEAAAEVGASIAAAEGATVIPPFDDADVVAGQGTVATEMLAAHPGLEVLLVPVGGGGLVAGMAVAAKAHDPAIEVIGVQTERYPTLVRVGGVTGTATGTATGTMRGAAPTAGTGPTVADGIAVARPGRITAPIIEALVDDVVAVPEDSIEQAIALYLEVEKVVAEGAGAVPLAAVLADRARWRGRQVGLVLSGGNIDMRTLASVITRALARSGRLSRLHVVVSDTPGTLGALTARIGALGGNVADVEHRRDRPDLPLRAAQLVLSVETRDRRHAERIVEELRADGFAVDLEPSASLHPLP